MIPQNNNTLVQALHGSDEVVFQELYDTYSDVVFRNIFKMLPRQQDAEDLLQCTFLKLWESRNRLTAEQSVDGWLFTTSFYLTMNKLRAIARDRLQVMGELPVDIAETTEAPDLYTEKLTLLQKAVNLLPNRKKQAFELCKLEGKSYREAALALGISEETVKEHVKSAMGILRREALQADLLLLALLTVYHTGISS